MEADLFHLKINFSCLRLLRLITNLLLASKLWFLYGWQIHKSISELYEPQPFTVEPTAIKLESL